MKLKMKYCMLPLLILLLSCMLCICVFAESGFNAGLDIDRTNEAAGSFSVTVVHSSILSEKTPTLCLPCTYTAAQITAPDGSTKPGEIVNGEIRFKVFMGGTYTIQAGSTKVDAVTPVISTQPISANYFVGDAALPLTVSASITDAGMISYQWYSNTANSNTGGTAISGAISASYTPSTDTAGTKYYYVVVTNTNANATGEKSASVTSETAAITVTRRVDAVTPVIEAQPISANYFVGDAALPLTVNASITDAGMISYQWYSNTLQSTADGTEIPGATSASYTPSIENVGTTYYYVVVTNTNDNATGEKVASVTSETVAITVTRRVEAVTPVISTQPVSANYFVGDAALPFTVNASITDAGTISYQWYSNSANSNTGGTAIPGATEASYTPSTDTVGIMYYYVVVTNTNANATGAKVASATSEAAAITVTRRVDAVTPVINAQPVSADYFLDDAALPLTVTAQITDAGTISYQWYSNTLQSTADGTEIPGATSASYTPPTNIPGTMYYYVVVTNTNANATGAKVASVTSEATAITVTRRVDAVTPVISVQPVSANYFVGDAALPLTVDASVADAGTISYQWYSNTANSNIGGTAIPGETSSSYVPAADSVGVKYYYVVITNTNSMATGEQISSVSSDAAKITVAKRLYTIRGSITLFGEGSVTMELLKDGAAVDDVTITVTADSYTIANVPAGTYILRVSKSKHVTREYTVTVGNP